MTSQFCLPAASMVAKLTLAAVLVLPLRAMVMSTCLSPSAIVYDAGLS